MGPKLRPFLLLVCSVLVGCKGNTEARKAIFSSSQFAAPIAINAGEQDDPNLLAHARRNRVDTGILPTLYTTKYRFADKRLITFLVSGGYSSVECVTVTSRYESNDECFLLHTPRVRGLDSAAHRELISITYENEYKAAPLGVPLVFHAATFTYRIKSDLPNLPDVAKTFTGQAKAVLNPDNGRWEIAEFSLGDRGEREILDPLLATLQPYEPGRAQQAVATSAREERSTAAQPPAPLKQIDPCLMYKCGGDPIRIKKVAPLFESPDPKSRAIGRAMVGSELTPDNMAVVTSRPGVYEVTEPFSIGSPAYTLKKGERIYTYHHWGEGCFTAWVAGKLYGFSEPKEPGGLISGRGNDCLMLLNNVREVEKGHSEYWLRVPIQGGKKAWLRGDSTVFDWSA